MSMNKLLSIAQRLQPELTDWRRYIHHLAETGMYTHQTAAFVKETLEEMGYQANYVAGTGVTATAGGKRPGKCFLLRADMDAIEGLTEENDLAYKATNGNMHGCGHGFSHGNASRCCKGTQSL